MLHSHKRILTVTLLGLAFGIVGPGIHVAKAGFIDFESQAAGRGGNFTGAVDSPLVIGIATFKGGELLNNESSSIDLTGVYATIAPNLVSGAYTNPLTINFSTPVSGFSILVTNNFADSFTVADNLGGSSTLILPNNALQTFTLLDLGITSVTISAANHTTFDFAIDNVAFTSTDVAPVPEPATVIFGATAAVFGLAYAMLRKRKSLKG